MIEPISEVIDDEEDGMRPIIVQFQNSNLQEGEETQLTVGVYRKSANTKILAAATKEILYAGNVDRSEDGNYNRFLLARNKKTGKVRLIAVDVAILAPQLKQAPNDVIDKPSKHNASSISILNKEFGSKRIKRITEQRERLKMNIDGVKEQLEKTVIGVNIGDSESFTVESSENISIYRPPINRDASTVEEVYVLNEMVSSEVLDSLSEEADYVLSSDLDEFDTLSPFVKQHLTELQNSSVPNKLEKCELLLYIHYLITFVNKPAKMITKNLVLCESSKIVNDHILDNFSVTSNAGRTRMRPITMKDKTICYILVLCMIALDYELNMEVLVKSIKLGVKKIQEMARILAFSPHGKSKSIMVLKIPLPPAVSISPKKRRK